MMTHKEQAQKSSMETMDQSVNTKSTVSYTSMSGNDLYDDGYGGANKVHMHETPVKLDFQKISFFGRETELQQLERAYRSVICSATVAVEGSTSAAAADEPNPNPDSRDHHNSKLSQLHSSSRTELPAVFLWGVSGTGKTRLVRQFIDGIKQQQSKDGQEQGLAVPYILQGKHDGNTGRSDPFSAIVQALTDFCQQVLEEPEEEQDRIRKCIRQAFGDDIKVISKMVPSIRKILFPSNDQITVSIAAGGGGGGTKSVQDSVSCLSRGKPHWMDQIDSQTENVWNRLRYAFMSLIKAISTKERPIVLFLDDLQWSAQVSLDLLSTLLSDKNLNNFLLLGAIRQELNPHTDDAMELDPKLPLSEMFHDLGGVITPSTPSSKHENDDETIPNKWTDVALSNLSPEAIGRCLARLLDRDINSVQPLAFKIHAKTGGNIFFTLQLIEELERSNVLVYSRVAFQWEWNWPDDDESNVSNEGHQGIRMINNVIHIFSKKLTQLSPELRTILTMAAYIRFNFDLATLGIVLEAESKSPSSVDDFAFLDDASESALSALLEEAVLAGFLMNTIGGGTYRFSHDRVRQAAFELVPFGEVRSKLRQRIGKYLVGYCQGTDMTIDLQGRDQSLMFVAADHLNNSPSKDHLFSAELNLKVGQLASSMAALAQAAAYFDVAFTALKKVRDPWKEHYDLTLTLYQCRADVELNLSRYNIGYDLSREIFENAKSLDDKLPVYVSMAAGLGRDDRQLESLELNRSAAQLLGKYPKKAILGHIVKEMLAVRRYLKKHSDEQILQLPLMTNGHDLLAMQLISQTVFRSFFCEPKLDLFLGTLKMLRLSFKSGLCDLTGFALSTFALITSELGNMKNASRYAVLAKSILSRLENPSSFTSHVHSSCVWFVRSWTEPSLKFVGGYHRNFSRCMEVGDFETGFLTWNCCNILVQNAGYPCGPLHRSYQALFHQTAQYKVTSCVDVVTEFSLAPAVLLGHTPLDWESIRSFGLDVVKSQQNVQALRLGQVSRLSLATYFMQYDVAEELVRRLDGEAADDSSYDAVTLRHLYNGLMAAGRYQQTKKKSYLRQLRQMRRQNKKCCKTKGQAGLNRHLLLDARLLDVTTLTGSNAQKVQTAYNAAIRTSIECGHVHEAGLACELAGEYMLKRAPGNREMATDYFTKAFEYYKQWDAITKVADLVKRRGGYIDRGRYKIRCVEDCDPSKQGPILGFFKAGKKESKQTQRQELLSFDYLSQCTLIFGDRPDHKSVEDVAILGMNEIGKAGAANDAGDADDVSILTL